ncbi:hypothetical protein RUM44_004595 [Polyplax serrata]|uniref:Uncharacterized protein n=1 Tax=Polyplax serrata TaxID=468196 RepID=A0ABR1B3Q5_POLSC
MKFNLLSVEAGIIPISLEHAQNEIENYSSCLENEQNRDHDNWNGRFFTVTPLTCRYLIVVVCVARSGAPSRENEHPPLVLVRFGCGPLALKFCRHTRAGSEHGGLISTLKHTRLPPLNSLRLYTYVISHNFNNLSDGMTLVTNAHKNSNIVST